MVHENLEFMADGGTLAFGLRHIYPIKESLKHVDHILKGSNVVVYKSTRAHVCLSSSQCCTCTTMRMPKTRMPTTRTTMMTRTMTSTVSYTPEREMCPEVNLDNLGLSVNHKRVYSF